MRTECDKSLDDAERIVDHVDDDLPWGNACRTPAYLGVQRATCYGRMGLAREALDRWTEVLTLVPESARRDRAVFQARRAHALADTGEPDEAVRLVAEVAPLVAETGSARMHGELVALRAHMTPWQDEPVARDLDTILATVPSQSGGNA